jgi:nucleoside-diphosphate-sugar epimerase
MGYVFVTGGTGFIGSHIVQQLLARKGRWQDVRVLARSKASAAKVRAVGGVPVDGDLAEKGTWTEVVKNADYVVHCAQPNPQKEDYTLRARHEDHLLNALRQRGTRAVFVYGSSYYGASIGSTLIDERVKLRTPIGFGPAFEPWVRAVDEKSKRGFDVVAALPGGVYGRGSWFLEMTLDALRANQPVLLCEPAPLWPYVHVDDVAHGVVELLTVGARELDTNGRQVIIADNTPVTTERFVSLLADAVGKKPVLLKKSAAELAKMVPPIVAAYLSANMPHSNARMRKLGITLKYPELAAGIASFGLQKL